MSAITAFRAILDAGQPLCATQASPDDWTPEVENEHVPEALATVCRKCPLMADCLQWATVNEEAGYWAGTTSTQRRRGLWPAAVPMPRRPGDCGPSCHHHEPGKASVYYYKSGCHCPDCRLKNRQARALERQRARSTQEATA